MHNDPENKQNDLPQYIEDLKIGGYVGLDLADGYVHFADRVAAELAVDALRRAFAARSYNVIVQLDENAEISASDVPLVRNCRHCRCPCRYCYIVLTFLLPLSYLKAATSDRSSVAAAATTTTEEAASSSTAGGKRIHRRLE
jgi:hypothetical protein